MEEVTCTFTNAFRVKMGLLLYNLLLPVYLVVALPGMLIKMRRRGGYGAHFWQRFGGYETSVKRRLAEGPRPWWVHAVSVGEVLIANARLSPRSGRRYAKFRRLAEPILNRLSLVLTQEPQDGERWAAAGLAKEKIVCVGSVRFDPAAQPALDAVQVGALRRILDELWEGDRCTLLLGSNVP